MCGIFGYMTPTESAANGLHADIAVQSLRHRGPDDSGVVDLEVQGTRCTLAQTRLSILDLSSAGHQPMSTEDGGYWIVFNGEVFNFVEVRATLEAHGEVFRSNSDTEVILKAYRKWGTNCVERFRGMFAFAIFDSRARTLFLARDRLGIKPLYYTRLPCGGLAFASEIRALIAGGAASAKLSREGVASYFVFGSVSSPQTILDGVFSIEPGYSLTVHDESFEFASYWKIPNEDANPTPPMAEVTSELRQHLSDAMRLCLVSDVPVGIFLSGGVDSSALVALGSQVSSIPINTFTVVFDELEYSEERFATEVARHFQSKHHSIHLSAARALNEIDRAIQAMDQPSVDGPNTYFVSAAVREAGLKVALSGLGGDEIFAGYRHFRTFGPACRLSGLVRSPWARAAMRSLSGMTEWLPSGWRKLAALGACEGDPGAIYSVLRSIYVPAERRRFMMSPLGEDATHCQARLQSGKRRSEGDDDPVNTYSAFELSNYLRNTLLRDADTMSMAHGLEVRVPFLDHKVVEYAFRIHGSAKLRDGVNKPSLVDAVPELPSQSVNRPKMGFSLPLDAWCRGPLKTWFKAHVLETPDRLPGLFDRKALDCLWRSFEQEKSYLALARVWSVAMLSLWAANNNANI